MNWTSIAAANPDVELCLIFSDWLEEHGDTQRASGLRRMIREGKWPRVEQRIDVLTKSQKMREKALWISTDTSWRRPIHPHFIDVLEWLTSRTFISLGSKSYWSRQGYRLQYKGMELFAVENPVAVALEFGAHVLGRLAV